MVATKSAIHGNRKKILGFSEAEKPVALQVGGSDKNELSEVCKIAEEMGYDEININLGCPSKKVQKNKFSTVPEAPEGSEKYAEQHTEVPRGPPTKNYFLKKLAPFWG